MLQLKDGTTLKFPETVSDVAYMPLASVMLGDKGGIPDFNDPRLPAQILRNLADPDYIKRIAYGLVVLFPEMPDRLVWYEHPEKRPSFGIAGLSIEDITKIMLAVAERLNVKPTQQQRPSTGFRQPQRKGR